MIAVVREPNITELRDALFQVVHRGNLDFRSGERVIVAGDVKVTWKPRSHVEIRQREDVCYKWSEINGNSLSEKGSPEQLKIAVQLVKDHLRQLDARLEAGFEQFSHTSHIGRVA